jgi:virulence factor Mce-like protein
MSIDVRDHLGRGPRGDRLRLELHRALGPFAIFAVTAAVALTCAAIILRNIHVHFLGSGTRVAHVAVDNAKGIVPGKQEVRWAGVVVGKMTGVKLDAGKPVVSIEYDSKYGPLFRDARVRLRPQTVLDDMYLDIESGGHRQAGALGDAVLPADRTRVPVDISQVLDIFNSDTRMRMKEAIDQLGRGLSDRGAQLRAAFAAIAPFLHDAELLTREFARRRGLTSSLVHEFRTIVDELGARDRELTQLVSAGDATLSQLGNRAPAVEDLIAQLAPSFAQLRSSLGRLEGTLAAVDPALTALQPVAGALPAGMQALRRFSTDAQPALRALEPPVGSLSTLSGELRPAAASLSNAFAQLEPQAPAYDRITTKLLSCAPTLDKFFAWTQSVLKFGDANGTYPRGNGVQSASTYVPSQRDPVLTPHGGCATAQGRTQ